MKTTFTLFSMVLALNFAFSQTVITNFETGETPLYSTLTGANTENQTEFNMNADNPGKSGINTTNKCLYILTNQVIPPSDNIEAGRPQWGENNFTIEFENPITIDDNNRYLHILHWKERTLHVWLVYGTDANGTEMEIGRGPCTEAGKWFDMVADVKAKMTSLKKIRVILDGNWGATATEETFYPPTKFYYDEIILSGDPNPRGATYLTQSNILDFEDNSETNSKVTFTKQNNLYINDIFYDNDDKTGINTSDKCCYFNRNSGSLVWWHGFLFDLINPIDMGTNQYLHIMMKKSASETQNVQVSLLNLSGVQSAALMNNPLTTEWVDYVFTVPVTHQYIKSIYLKYNAAGADTGCFADEFRIDNDPTPRTQLPPTSTKQNTLAEKYTIDLSGKQLRIQSNENTTLSIRIYTIDGCLVNDQQTSSLNMEFTSSGIYLLNIDGKTEKIIVK